MEESDVDYVSLPFTPSTTPRLSMVPPPGYIPGGGGLCPPQSAENNPEICVTNATGDEIKFVFGSAAATAAASLTGSCQVLQPEMAEPMDHS